MKTLSNTNSEDAKRAVLDIQFKGNPDRWKLLCKAWSKKECWMKSTKVMELRVGCLVLVSTQQGDNISESLTFVPGVHYHDF